MVAIKEEKWRCEGHIARRDDNRWNKRQTDLTPRESKRDRRRQDRRWRDEIEKTRRDNLATAGEIARVLEKIKGGLCPAVDYERLMMMMMMMMMMMIYKLISAFKQRILDY